MMRVAVLDDWQGIAARIVDWSSVSGRSETVFFREPFASVEAAATALADFDVVLAMRERTRISAELVSVLPRLRLLTYTGPRNASVDVGACTAHGVLVCNTLSGRSGPATAELTLALILACARHVALGDAEIRAGRFQSGVPAGIELKGRTLGLLGLGRIGGTVARYGHALEMDVVAWSQNLTDERAAEAGAARVSKDELLDRADVVSLHLVLSDRSRGILGRADIARLKPGAIVVNTSRAGLVDQPALVEALHAGRVAAGLDVFDIEPLPADDLFRSAPNCVLSPHLGYATADNMADFYRDSVENIARWLDGSPVRVVNPEVQVKPAA